MCKLGPGDRLTKVAGISILSLPHAEVLRRIQAAETPVTLHFLQDHLLSSTYTESLEVPPEAPQFVSASQDTLVVRWDNAGRHAGVMEYKVCVPG